MRGARSLENSQYMTTAVRVQSTGPAAFSVAASTSAGSCFTTNKGTAARAMHPDIN